VRKGEVLCQSRGENIHVDDADASDFTLRILAERCERCGAGTAAAGRSISWADGERARHDRTLERCKPAGVASRPGGLLGLVRPDRTRSRRPDDQHGGCRRGGGTHELARVECQLRHQSPHPDAPLRACELWPAVAGPFRQPDAGLASDVRRVGGGKQPDAPTAFAGHADRSADGGRGLLQRVPLCQPAPRQRRGHGPGRLEDQCDGRIERRPVRAGVLYLRDNPHAPLGPISADAADADRRLAVWVRRAGEQEHSGYRAVVLERGLPPSPESGQWTGRASVRHRSDPHGRRRPSRHPDSVRGGRDGGPVRRHPDAEYFLRRRRPLGLDLRFPRLLDALSAPERRLSPECQPGRQ